MERGRPRLGMPRNFEIAVSFGLLAVGIVGIWAVYVASGSDVLAAMTGFLVAGADFVASFCWGPLKEIRRTTRQGKMTAGQSRRMVALSWAAFLAGGPGAAVALSMLDPSHDQGPLTAGFSGAFICGARAIEWSLAGHIRSQDARSPSAP